MMTSSNGNIFRVTGHLCGEFTGPRWIPSKRPVTRSFDVFCVWINGWVKNREAGDLRRNRAHYDVIIMIMTVQWHWETNCLWEENQCNLSKIFRTVTLVKWLSKRDWSVRQDEWRLESRASSEAWRLGSRDNFWDVNHDKWSRRQKIVRREQLVKWFSVGSICDS